MALPSAYGASVLSTVAWDAASVGTWVADVLIVLGILVMTIGVYGVVRMPDTYTRLHVASKMVFLGAMPLLLASALVGGQDVALRVILIAFFILLTTPVSAHMVGRAAYLRGERIKSPEPVEEETNRDF
ncbi:MAG TPA: monovalent cation/H(+) antiporter subunit G [Rubrobacteraceae bacterium]